MTRFWLELHKLKSERIRELAEAGLQRWRVTSKSTRMRISRVKTEYLYRNGGIDSAGNTAASGQRLLVFRCYFQEDGDSKVRKQVRSGWSRWRRFSGSIYVQEVQQ